MQHKKIALFISHIYGDYQKNLSQGVIDKALEYGFQTEVYATNDGENLGNFSATEDCILSLPAYKNLDGIIFASGTYANSELREDLRKKLSTLNDIPVIEVADADYSFPNISLENNVTAGILTDHMINTHNARRLCYFGDNRHPEFSVPRQNSFDESLKRNNISSCENDYFYVEADSPDSVYDDAIKHFTKNGTENPDAIICYNDSLALALWRAAANAGLTVPDDLAITGCDNLEAGRYYDPPLTTVSYPIYRLGTASVDSLINLIKGKEYVPVTVFAEPVYGGSCGCSYRKNQKPHVYSHSLELRVEGLERSILTSARMSSAFSHAVEMDDGLDYIADFASQIEGLTGFYLCLTEGWDNLSSRTRQLTEGSSEPAVKNDTMELKLAIRNGKRLPDCTFKNTSLLPDFLMGDEENARIVSPIFNHVPFYGYIVMTFNDNLLKYPFWLIQWLVNISQLLYNLRNRKNTEALSERLEEIYMRDSLTGLYNKNGFDWYKKDYIKKMPARVRVSALFFDLNGLKAINDTYGHSEGDFAISVLGQAISHTLSGHELSARTGGDEFNVILEGDSDVAELFLKNVGKYLENYNRLSDKEYKVSTGMGYANGVITDEYSLNELIKEADRRMYENKKLYKQKNT
ncbi:MAG: substrate-binding domain-containing protein [Lachnospiraceae bacterium]|nr:substrate-binding domain-containing protein [Lachnospiraceae bacterium]